MAKNSENSVSVFIDSDGVVRRGAWATSSSTVCIRDGSYHLRDVAPSDGVRAEDVAASLDRIVDALNNDLMPHVSGDGYARIARAVAADTKPSEASVQWAAPHEQAECEARTAGPAPHPKPIVRCGQRWRLDGVEVELYDKFPIMFVARNWDGVRVPVFASDLQERGVFLSGPTEPETKAEAVRRVLDIEARNPPHGMSRDEWRALLINRVRERTSVPTGTIRMMSATARAEVAEKWRRFGGGR